MKSNKSANVICAGIDAGSRTLKIVLLDVAALSPIACGVVDQGIDQDRVANDLLERLLSDCGLCDEDVSTMVATGYGRKLITRAAATMTEITCQAWGIRHSVPGARTIIDIGGQDSKLVCLREDGTVADFVMNDRCAAGTGRFLEILTAQLGVKLTELDALVRQSSHPATISSMCVVFAETEIVGLLADGTPTADILTGVQAAIASRIAAMSGRHLGDGIIFTGGVALVPGMAESLRLALGKPVRIAPQPQFTCALGAALLAAEQNRSSANIFT